MESLVKLTTFFLLSPIFSLLFAVRAVGSCVDCPIDPICAHPNMDFLRFSLQLVDGFFCPMLLGGCRKIYISSAHS